MNERLCRFAAPGKTYGKDGRPVASQIVECNKEGLCIADTGRVVERPSEIPDVPQKDCGASKIAGTCFKGGSLLPQPPKFNI